MTRIVVRQPAPALALFKPDAFASQIGEDIAFTAPGKSGTARLVAARVADDGRSVMLTVDVADGLVDLGDIVGVSTRPS